MGYEDEDWLLSAALQDDSLAADLLLSLRHAPPSRKQNKPAPLQGLQVEWTVRQPRSKASCKDSNNSNNTVKKQKKVECGVSGGGGGSNRASPTTPLSWSGGGGGTESSGGDGFEESSSLPANRTRDNARSKLNIATRTPGSVSTVGAKRPRRKKTLAELKEEECLLLKESRNLRQELADLKARFEKERATNDRLKRLKLDLQEQHATTAEMAEQHESVKAVSKPDVIPLKSRESPDASMQQCSTSPHGDVSEKMKLSSCQPEFLPDLNALPDLNQIPEASDFDVL